jgi:hypothetical protein
VTFDQKVAGRRIGAPACIKEFMQTENEELQFEVNNQAYFLNYVEDEGRWYVFRPTGNGMIRIPVEIEAVHSEHFAFAPEEGKKRVVH